MCGFSDVRRDENGYFCSVCGQRMRPNFANEIRLTLPPPYLKQLKRQCKVQNREVKP